MSVVKKVVVVAMVLFFMIDFAMGLDLTNLKRFKIVKPDSLQCEPILIRAKILKYNRSSHVTVLKIVSETYRGYVFLVNKNLKRDYVRGLLCKKSREFSPLEGKR